MVPFCLRLRARARAPPPRCGRLQARRRTERLPSISPFAIDLRLRAALSPRARRSDWDSQHPSRASSSAQRTTDGAERAHALCRCGGEVADAARRAAQPAPNVNVLCGASACGLRAVDAPARAAYIIIAGGPPDILRSDMCDIRAPAGPKNFDSRWDVSSLRD